MKVQIDRDKNLPQFYLTGFVTDDEFERIEQEVNPQELFRGLKSGQVMAAAIAGMVYGMMLREQEATQAANKTKIEVIS
jgi:hypothetical protein